jgi:hypothetical protein
MRFILMHKANKNSEENIPPSPALIANMRELVDEMAREGALVAAEGLQPSLNSIRLKFTNGARTVYHGPLTGSNELIAGIAIIEAESTERAIEWASLLGGSAGDVEIDIGLIKEPWDLGLCPKTEGKRTRFMLMYKADKVSEAGAASTGQSMKKWTQEMSEAGVLLLAASLLPSSKASRLKFRNGKRTVTDGPFTESKELIGGFCMLQVESKEQALEWGLRFANVICASLNNGELEVDMFPLF